VTESHKKQTENKNFPEHVQVIVYLYSNFKQREEELHILYSSPNIRQIKSRNEVGETCGMHGRGEECVQGFDGKARRKEATWKTKA
jgi:hypothetical protein